MAQKQAIRQLFSELQQTARQQAELLSQAGSDNIDDTITRLTELIDQRQRVMKEIDQGQQLAQKPSREKLESGEVKVIESIEMEEAAVRKSILAIQSCDDESRAHAERLLQLLGTEAGKARKNLQALKSYGASGQYSASQFFDGYK